MLVLDVHKAQKTDAVQSLLRELLGMKSWHGLWDIGSHWWFTRDKVNIANRDNYTVNSDDEDEATDASSDDEGPFND